MRSLCQTWTIAGVAALFMMTGPTPAARADDAAAPGQATATEQAANAGSGDTGGQARAIAKLRAQILKLSPADVGLAPSTEHPQVWGLVTEAGYAKGVATLVTLLNGDVSLYFSNGGGLSGAGQHAQVRQLGLAMIGAAEGLVDQTEVATDFPLPAEGPRASTC